MRQISPIKYDATEKPRLLFSAVEEDRMKQMGVSPDFSEAPPNTAPPTAAPTVNTQVSRVPVKSKAGSGLQRPLRVRGGGVNRGGSSGGGGENPGKCPGVGVATKGVARVAGVKREAFRPLNGLASRARRGRERPVTSGPIKVSVFGSSCTVAAF